MLGIVKFGMNVGVGVPIQTLFAWAEVTELPRKRRIITSTTFTCRSCLDMFIFVSLLFGNRQTFEFLCFLLAITEQGARPESSEERLKAVHPGGLF